LLSFSVSRLLRLPLLVPSLLAPGLRLLLRRRALLLLRLDHLLPGSVTLSLLLLAFDSLLVLGLNRGLSRLADLLALSRHCPFGRSLIHLLFAQVLQLLARVPVAARRLFGQIGNLPFARLLSADIR